ncbi:MAG: 2-oxo acid dehydrogenase subunit E2, partial [Deltaproteobacteria bacterium]|nr:2-oxo acid dehydrogenase subunit E2 [Deltaproteobacteria bacterium]
MIKELFIPRLSMAMEDAAIAEWLFNDGDWVEKDEIVFVINTEKVAYEIEAPISGFLTIQAQVEAVVPCGVSAGLLAETKEELETARPMAPTQTTDMEVLEPEAASEAGSEAPQTGAAKDPRARVFISPVARKVAEINKIDIATVSGSGPQGRIIKRDIEQAIEERKAAPAAPAKAAPATAVAADANVYDGKRFKEIIPVTGMRKFMADHMAHSAATAARVTTMSEIDMTQLLGLRKRLLEKEALLGVRVSITDLIIFAVARALKAAPIVNSTLVDDKLYLWDEINIGVALSLAAGGTETDLVVPVIKNADRKSVVEIGMEMRELIA